MYLLCRGVTFLHVLHVQCAEREREGTTGAGAALKKFAKRWRKASFGIVDAGVGSSNINDVWGMAGSLTRRKNPGILQLSWSSDMNGLDAVSRKAGRLSWNGSAMLLGL